MNRLHRAVPIRREHSLSVNVRVVAWAVVDGLLSAPVLGLLLFTVPAAVVGEALLAVVDAVASAGGWFHDRAGRIARGRKWRAHNDARRRRVCEWVGRLSGIPVPTPDELGRGFDVGNGISAHWSRGPDVRLMPGHHFAPLFDGVG